MSEPIALVDDPFAGFEDENLESSTGLGYVCQAVFQPTFVFWKPTNDGWAVFPQARGQGGQDAAVNEAKAAALAAARERGLDDPPIVGRAITVDLYRDSVINRDPPNWPDEVWQYVVKQSFGQGQSEAYTMLLESMKGHVLMSGKGEEKKAWCHILTPQDPYQKKQYEGQDYDKETYEYADGKRVRRTPKVNMVFGSKEEAQAYVSGDSSSTASVGDSPYTDIAMPKEYTDMNEELDWQKMITQWIVPKMNEVSPNAPLNPIQLKAVQTDTVGSYAPIPVLQEIDKVRLSVSPF